MRCRGNVASVVEVRLCSLKVRGSFGSEERGFYIIPSYGVPLGPLKMASHSKSESSLVGPSATRQGGRSVA